jgi:hypothetical protein
MPRTASDRRCRIQGIHACNHRRWRRSRRTSCTSGSPLPSHHGREIATRPRLTRAGSVRYPTPFRVLYDAPPAARSRPRTRRAPWMSPTSRRLSSSTAVFTTEAFLLTCCPAHIEEGPRWLLEHRITARTSRGLRSWECLASSETAVDALSCEAQPAPVGRSSRPARLQRGPSCNAWFRGGGSGRSMAAE